MRRDLLVGATAGAAALVGFATGAAPRGAGQWTGLTLSLLGVAALALWRRWPVAVAVAGPPLVMSPALLGPEPGDALLLVLLAYAGLAAERFGGRAAWLAAAGYLGYVGLLYALTGDDSPGFLVLTLPAFVAGTALRLRRETAEELAERGRELDAERELFAELSVRNERARIASELHDIVGHALSVMVVQAAAGQRLADRSPQEASASLAAIAASARQGREDLKRLIDLLAGTEVAGPDLSLVDEIVRQAARSGLRVSCRLEGDRDGVAAAGAHAAVRVVQESLTNALRHAPGAEVRVLVRGRDRGLTVRVENDAAPLPGAPVLIGTGRGLLGLRERVRAAGGTFTAGPSPTGGWHVEAHLPT